MDHKIRDSILNFRGTFSRNKDERKECSIDDQTPKT